MPQVILVDKNDNEIGAEEKIKAHHRGLLHRALSVFIFNSEGELMIQQRAKNKYHCGGLWSNTVCSHPIPGEKTIGAAHRRLKEELGFDCKLEEIFSFIYKSKFNNGLTEYELDHVFVGTFNKAPAPNSDEVSDWKWINLKNLSKDVSKNPDKYTYWFKKIFKDVFLKAEHKNID